MKGHTAIQYVVVNLIDWTTDTAIKKILPLIKPCDPHAILVAKTTRKMGCVQLVWLRAEPAVIKR